MSRGGARQGAGRPPKPENEKSHRKQRQLRAYEDEWQVIKQFAEIVRKDWNKAMQILSRQ